MIVKPMSVGDALVSHLSNRIFAFVGIKVIVVPVVCNSEKVYEQA